VVWRIFAPLKEQLGVEVGSDISFTSRKNPWEIEFRSDPKPLRMWRKISWIPWLNAVDHPITQHMDQPLLLRAVRTVGPVENVPKMFK
jgi:hypothetical protein